MGHRLPNKSHPGSVSCLLSEEGKVQATLEKGSELAWAAHPEAFPAVCS